MSFRYDINGLRAIAVIAVVLFHFKAELVPAGYLGVDVFFVISGYVITKSLHSVSKNGNSLVILNFYVKRIKRIYPALIVCVLITTFLFLKVSTRPEKSIFDVAFWSLVGFSNMSLYFQAQDYFSLDAELNPFTQTWSLGVEEQFYLIYPIILVFFGFFSKREINKNLLITLVVMTVLSFVTYEVFAKTNADAAFYIIVSRFWELCAGCLTFLFFKDKKVNVNQIFILFLLILCFFIPFNCDWLLVPLSVFLTILILRAENKSKFNLLNIKPMQYIGKISYSLYLWHWSVLVLGKWTIGTSYKALFILLLVSFLCAMMSYHMIEKPLNTNRFNNRGVIVVFIICIATSLHLVGTEAPKEISSYNRNISEFFNFPSASFWNENYLECHGRAKTSKFENPLEHCLSRKGNKPIIYLIGDSHAAQLIFMLDESVRMIGYDYKFINLERDFPYDFINGKKQSEVLDYIVETSRENDVVMVSFHRGRLNSQRDKHEDEKVTNSKVNNFINAFDIYAKKLKNKKINIILSLDTPLMNVVSTSESCAFQLYYFGESVCTINFKKDINTRWKQNYAYQELKKNNSNIYIWDPLLYMYDGKDSFDVIDGNREYLMWDWNHISEYQSRKLSVDFINDFSALGLP